MQVEFAVIMKVTFFIVVIKRVLLLLTVVEEFADSTAEKFLTAQIIAAHYQA